MKKITIVFLLMLLVIFGACKKRKNNKAADKLEGAWDLTEYTYAGKEVPLVKKQVMYFYSDPLFDKYNKGDGKIETSYGGYTFEQWFKYEVGNKGDDLALEIEFLGSSAITLAKIDKVNRRKLVYIINDGNDAEFVFKKRK